MNYSTDAEMNRVKINEAVTPLEALRGTYIQSGCVCKRYKDAFLDSHYKQEDITSHPSFMFTQNLACQVSPVLHLAAFWMCPKKTKQYLCLVEPDQQGVSDPFQCNDWSKLQCLTALLNIRA